MKFVLIALMVFSSTEALESLETSSTDETTIPENATPEPTPSLDEPQSSTTDQPSSCSPWPENLLPLRDCCNVPSLIDERLMENCFMHCGVPPFRRFKKKIDRKLNEKSDCAVQCYANMTSLIKNGKLDKEVSKNLLTDRSFVRSHRLMFPKWVTIYAEFADKCEFDESKDVTTGLAEYFECIRENMVNNCVSFRYSEECQLVENHYWECSGKKRSCYDWPPFYHPQTCCILPQLFNTNIRETCRQECAKKHFFMPMQNVCTQKCMFVKTKIISEEKCDLNVVKSLLLENTKGNNEWNKPIEDSVNECKNMIGESELKGCNNNKLQALFLPCIAELLRNKCVEFREDGVCKGIRNYVKDCPFPKQSNRFRNLRNIYRTGRF